MEESSIKSGPSSNQEKTDMCGGERIKRPMNAFMVWAKDRRREIRKKTPSLHQSQVSDLLSKEWRAMSKDGKSQFCHSMICKESNF